ncbi:uncharacterized protein BXIN_2149 [Babesia sp. Xinjiang]|uniref:uncharacterized protein n=1 Tax=Babesia sp. Xinjiang TaxID=462227 RepID=UPI000A250F4A|nr:uncharacterized protein BXIN_2149 [Babesia sp. Xinjiang]ORM40510.1 hypothetical protein BXIN_2149 [Babesia sp. Xinjiang]
MDDAPRAPPSKKAPIVDNFVLLFHNNDENTGEQEYLDAESDADLSPEESFRWNVRNYLQRIEELRAEITDKYLAKQSTQAKLDAQLFELQLQSKYNALNVQKCNAIKVNYQRKLLLCQKIYSLAVQLQTIYIELAEMVENRMIRTTELHRSSRLCASTLYEYKKRMES